MVLILLPEVTIGEVCISGENVHNALIVLFSIFIVEVSCSLAIEGSIGTFPKIPSSKSTRAIFF